MNRKLFLALLLGLCAMAVSGALVHVLGLSQARIEVAVALVVYACLSFDTPRAALCSYAAGYLFDLMTGAPTGLYAFVAMLTFVVCRVVVVMADVRGVAGFAVLTLFIDAVHQLLAYGLIDFFAGRTGPHAGPAALYALPATAALTALAAAALYPAFHQLDLAFDRDEASSLIH